METLIIIAVFLILILHLVIWFLWQLIKKVKEINLRNTISLKQSIFIKGMDGDIVICPRREEQVSKSKYFFNKFIFFDATRQLEIKAQKRDIEKLINYLSDYTLIIPRVMWPDSGDINFYVYYICDIFCFTLDKDNSCLIALDLSGQEKLKAALIELLKN